MERTAQGHALRIRRALERRLRAVVRAVVDLLRTPRGAAFYDGLELELVRVTALPPSALGVDPAPRRSPSWYQTDLALYTLRYENGWGKAEAECVACAECIGLPPKNQREAHSIRDAA